MPSRFALLDFLRLDTRGYQAWTLRLVAGLCWLVCLVGIGRWAELNETDQLRQEALRDLQVQSLSLRSIAERYKHIPYISALQQDVEAFLLSDDDKTLASQVDLYLQDVNRRAGAEVLYLMNMDGICVAASNWHLGIAGSYKNGVYHYLQHFQQALQRGWGVDYATVSNHGQPGLFYASPVFTGTTKIGVMAVKVRLTDIENSWAAASSPLFLLDKSGIVILAADSAHLYQTTRALNPDQLAELQYKRGQYGREPDGTPKVFKPLAWTPEPAISAGYVVARMSFRNNEGRYLVVQEQLPDYDWTLVATKDLFPAFLARWTAMAIAALLSTVVLLVVFLWRQRGLRLASLHHHQQELEGRVSQRTRDLAQANVLLKAMKDSLPVGIRIMNEDGELTDLNAKVCEITGYSADELLRQRPPYAYWHPEEIDKHSRDLQSALEGNATAVGQEQRFRHKSGLDIHVLIYTAPLMYGGKRHGYVSSMVDITRQKHIEDKQRLQEEAMLSTAALASMGELVFSLTHELGSPFLSISSAIEVAKRHLELRDLDALKTSLHQIGQQSQRAREIMQRIRNRVPKHEAGFHACDVNAIVANVLGLLKGEFRRQKAKSQTQLQTGSLKVMADDVLLEQVLLNLIMNALQCMQHTPSKDRVVVVETGTLGQEVFIRVADRGPGIPPSVASQLFNLFYTTKTNGLGVGLNFCKTTIETHSGRLEFANREIGGAEFTIYLPLPAK
ncbi:MAG: hypothetical protein CFE44_03700 [Burkholderiales bacterium PBB4]|nr:MAG: hypothetical protein CFE44_03700 [Burkholderiales bacterium PBB4]